MNCRLDHSALNCKLLSESQFIAKRMIRVPSEPGISHYGFVADDIEQVATELRGKTAELSREIRAPR